MDDYCDDYNLAHSTPMTLVPGCRTQWKLVKDRRIVLTDSQFSSLAALAPQKCVYFPGLLLFGSGNQVFFKDALEHIARILRLLRQERGSAVLPAYRTHTGFCE